MNSYFLKADVVQFFQLKYIFQIEQLRDTSTLISNELQSQNLKRLNKETIRHQLSSFETIRSPEKMRENRFALCCSLLHYPYMSL